MLPGPVGCLSLFSLFSFWGFGVFSFFFFSLLVVSFVGWVGVGVGWGGGWERVGVRLSPFEWAGWPYTCPYVDMPV